MFFSAFHLGVALPALVIAAAETVSAPTAAVIASDDGEASLRLAGSVSERLAGAERVSRMDAAPGSGLEVWVLDPSPWEGEPPTDLVALVGVIEADGLSYGAAEVYELASARLLSRAAFSPAPSDVSAGATWVDEVAGRLAGVVSLAATPAEVISSRRGGLVLNAGTRDGLRAGQSLDAYRPGEERVDLETGEIVRGDEVLVGRVVVTRVVEGIAEAEVTSGDPSSLRVGTLCRPAIERLPG